MAEVDDEKLRERLREKLLNMPIITQKLRKIKGKDGRDWFTLETRITQFLSPLYVKKMLESKNDGETVRKTQSDLY